MKQMEPLAHSQLVDSFSSTRYYLKAGAAYAIAKTVAATLQTYPEPGFLFVSILCRTATRSGCNEVCCLIKINRR